MYTSAMVGFHVLLMLLPVHYAAGAVSLVESGTAYEGRHLACIPAAFGPKVSKKGLLGRVQLPLVDDLEGPRRFSENAILKVETGCVPFRMVLPTVDDLPGIALIRRSAPDDEVFCSFVDKVVHAEAAGASGVIVYDYVQRGLLQMGPRDPVDVNLRIPTVFVDKRSGNIMRDFIQLFEESQRNSSAAGSGPKVHVEDHQFLLNQFWNEFNIVAGATCGFVIAAILLRVYFYRRFPRMFAAREGGDADENGNDGRKLTQDELGSISQQITYRSLEELERPILNVSCSICLEEFNDGEVVRVLHCKHGFHDECITPWVTERQPRCPLCKADLISALESDTRGNASDASSGGSAPLDGTDDQDTIEGVPGRSWYLPQISWFWRRIDRGEYRSAREPSQSV